MRLTILTVAYPLAPVAPDTAGGGEQVLWQLDRALVAAGHRSLVVAREGSQVSGELIATQTPPPQLDENAKRLAQGHQAAVLRRVLRDRSIDLVHMHGIDFDRYLPPPGPPVLVTLHVPLQWYAREALRPKRPDTYLHCVSGPQHESAPPDVELLPPIENGVDLGVFTPRRKRNFALFLGRICPEKGVHLAIEAAERAGVPLLIAGQVFAYPEHQRHFEEQIAPRLNRNCRFIGTVGLAQKRRLLGTARCVLLPSLADETSSLVAREALAAGAPVVAFARGALADAIEDGRTGFLVRSAAEMADAIRACEGIDHGVCRAEAERRFPLAATVDSYFRVYRSLVRAKAAA